MKRAGRKFLVQLGTHGAAHFHPQPNPTPPCLATDLVLKRPHQIDQQPSTFGCVPSGLPEAIRTIRNNPRLLLHQFCVAPIRRAASFPLHHIDS
jgi:hypothetical protein